MADDAESVRCICEAIREAGAAAARNPVRERLPFAPPAPASRRASLSYAVRLFTRDVYVDPYTGDRLVVPGVLRLLSALFPDEIPYHPNWKAGLTHPIYWVLQPTIDHVIPIGRG